MADDTTALSYWLNWRFFLCALWIFGAMIAAVVLIIKYEVFNKNTSYKKDDEHDAEPIGILYEDETWRTSLKALHPAWLLLFRLFAFGVMLALLIANVIVDGADILYFYTQWTFTLVAFYFANLDTASKMNKTIRAFQNLRVIPPDRISDPETDQREPPNNRVHNSSSSGSITVAACNLLQPERILNKTLVNN